MYFFPLWWGLDWSKWGRGLARNIIYNQNIIVINDKCSCSEDIHKKFFFNFEEGLIDQREERRRWRTCRKSRFSRLHPRFISNSKPNQSINQSNGMLLRMISNKFQRNEQILKRLLIYFDIMVLTKTEKFNAITSTISLNPFLQIS